MQHLLQGAKQGNGQLMLKRPKCLGGLQGRSFKGSVREGAAGYVIGLCTILGLVGIKVKFQAYQSSGFKQSMFLQSAVFIWRGSASCKNNSEMCVRPLSISYRELGVQCFCCVVDS